MRPSTHIQKLAGACLALATLLISSSPALAHDTAIEAANKRVVTGFYEALNSADATGTIKQRIKGIAEKFIAPNYIQHSEMFAGLPGPGNAREKLVRMFEGRPAMKLPPAKTLAVMAEGDLVMMLTARDIPDPATGAMKPAYIFNMFRVQKGRLVEHWDSPMPMPMAPPSAGIPAENL
jgi:predicted SnoaL-like aldol condensation-catalyzing enzyme